MKLRWIFLLAATLAVGTLGATAQPLHMGNTVYVKSRLGLAQYTGENSRPLLANTCGNVTLGCERQSYGAGVEAGIQFTRYVGASVSYQTATYPSIAALRTVSPSYAQNFRLRRTFHALSAYSFPDLSARFTPYLQAGFHVTSGRTLIRSTLPSTSGPFRTVERWAFGPSFRAGLEISINHRLSIFSEAATSVAFPDDAVDGEGGFFGTDRLSWAGFGLKVKNVRLPRRLFRSRSEEMDMLPTVPSTLDVDEVGTFTVEPGDPSATVRHDFQWTFDDGVIRHGRVVTKQFSEPGSHRVTLRRTDADRDAPEAMQTFYVQVRPRPVPIHIASIVATPDSALTDVPVAFQAEVSGGPPNAYRWYFGDGTVGFTPRPTHSYSEADTYEVTVEVRSAADTTSHTRTLTVHEEPSAAPDVPVNTVVVDTVAYVVQLGAFSSRARAERFAHRHAAGLPAAPTIHHDLSTGYHLVQLGFATEQEATRAVRRFRQTEALAGAFLRTPVPSASYPTAAQPDTP